MRNKNDEGLILCGGSSLYNGAHLELYGKDFSAANGAFKLTTIRADGGSINLFGNGSGGLWWMGNDLAGAAIVAKNLAENGYIKFANGLILQWTHNRINDGNEWTTSNAGSGLFRNVPFPIAYTTDSNRIVFFASYREGGFSSFVKVKTGSYSLTVFEEWISEMPSSPYAAFEHLSIGR